MSRDELIEELKKAPVNGEVCVTAKVPEHSNRMVDSGLNKIAPRLRIQTITTIPIIEIEVSYD